MKAQWSTVTAPATDMAEGDRWDNFLEEVRACPRCGRSSMLHQACPACGARMARVWPGSFQRACWREWTLRAISLLILCGAFAVLFSCGFGTLGKIVVIAAVVVTLLAELALLLLRFHGEDDERNLHVMSMEREWSHYPKLPQQASDRFRSLERTCDAYHEDLLWLDREVGQLQDGDHARRDELFAQALRLSRVCDCGRLAMLRFQLLCRANLYEGAYTDIDQITGMLLTEHMIIDKILKETNGVRTLCDCIRLDPLGAMGKSSVKTCVLLVANSYNARYKKCLSEEDRENLRGTLAYCGTFAIDVDARETWALVMGRSFDALCRMEPAFHTLREQVEDASDEG